MKKRTNGTRFARFDKWGLPDNKEYDYMNEGIIQYMFSARIVYSKNKTLRTILGFFEKSVFFLLKYVDELKYFKDYHRKNR